MIEEDLHKPLTTGKTAVLKRQQSSAAARENSGSAKVVTDADQAHVVSSAKQAENKKGAVETKHVSRRKLKKETPTTGRAPAHTAAVPEGDKPQFKLSEHEKEGLGKSRKLPASTRTRQGQSSAASSSGGASRPTTAKRTAEVADLLTPPEIRDPPQNWYATAADKMLRGVLPTRYTRAPLSTEAEKDPPRRLKNFDAASIPDVGVPLRTWSKGSVPVCPWPTQTLQKSVDGVSREYGRQTPPPLVSPTVEATSTAMPKPVIDKTQIEPSKCVTVDKSILEKHTKVRSERRTLPNCFSEVASTTMLPGASTQLADAPNGEQVEWAAGFDRDRFEGYRRPKKAPKQKP